MPICKSKVNCSKISCLHNAENLCYTAVVATIAQLVVHLIRNQKVTGSSPVCGRKVKRGSLTSLFFLFFSAIMELSIVIGILINANIA